MVVLMMHCTGCHSCMLVGRLQSAGALAQPSVNTQQAVLMGGQPAMEQHAVTSGAQAWQLALHPTGSCSCTACSSCLLHSLSRRHSCTAACSSGFAELLTSTSCPLLPVEAATVNRHEGSAGWKLMLLTACCSDTATSFLFCRYMNNSMMFASSICKHLNMPPMCLFTLICRQYPAQHATHLLLIVAEAVLHSMFTGLPPSSTARLTTACSEHHYTLQAVPRHQRVPLLYMQTLHLPVCSAIA